jgi:hypothetical protein
MTPVMSIQDPLYTDVCNYPLKIRWRISKDPHFKGLVAKVNSESKDLTTYQPSELILEPNTIYYWKVKFLGAENNNSEWSDVFSFATADARDDADMDGITDNDEVEASDDIDEDGTPDDDQNDDIKSCKLKKGDMKLGIRPQNCVITNLKPLDEGTLSAEGNQPDQIPYGLVSYRLEVDSYGDTATVQIYLSSPAPPNAKWVFFDEIEGWQDFSNHAVFSADRTMLTVELKDGGYGDNDHIENKVIVDPSGIGIFDAGSSGGGSCFISTVTQW